MTAFTLTVLFLTVAVGFLFSFGRKRWLGNPAALFVLGQTIFFLGTLPFLDWASPVDREYAYLMTLCVTTFCLTAGSVFMLKRVSAAEARTWRHRSLERIESGGAFDIMVYGLVVFSVVVSTGYFVTVGYNVILISVQSLLTTGRLLDDVATLRLESYAGSTYFAPGYVNQFKNTILPCLTFFLLARGLLTSGPKGRRDRLIAAILALPVAMFLLGTGQRGALVIAMAMGFLFMTAVAERRHRTVVNMSIIGFALVLFVGSSFLIGRTGATNMGGLTLEVAFQEIFKRVSSANQFGGLVGYRYIVTLDTVWGADWLQSLRDLLPGRPAGVSISSQVFAIMYGGTRGTAPPSVVGSAFYNFGYTGAMLVFGVMGVVYASVYVRFLRGAKTLFRCLIYISVSVLLGSWIAGAISYFANVGLVALIGMSVLAKMADARLGRRPALQATRRTRLLREMAS